MNISLKLPTGTVVIGVGIRPAGTGIPLLYAGQIDEWKLGKFYFKAWAYATRDGDCSFSRGSLWCHAASGARPAVRFAIELIGFPTFPLTTLSCYPEAWRKGGGGISPAGGVGGTPIGWEIL